MGCCFAGVRTPGDDADDDDDDGRACRSIALEIAPAAPLEWSVASRRPPGCITPPSAVSAMKAPAGWTVIAGKRAPAANHNDSVKRSRWRL